MKSIIVVAVCAWGLSAGSVFAEPSSAANPLLVPAAREKHVWSRTGQNWMERHEVVKREAQKGEAQLVFIGDSITHMFEDRGLEVWNKHYAPLKAINMGFGGDQVQHVLWRLQNGEVDGISPRVAVVMIGTNNAKNYPPEQTAEAIREICSLLRTKLPETRILLLAIFPRNTLQDPRHLTNLEVNRLIQPLAADPWIDYLDIGQAFVDADGSIPEDIMPGQLHPSLKGYQLWADAMNPVLMKLMEETR